MSDKKDFSSAIYNAFKRRSQRNLRKLKDRILKKAVLSFSKELFDLAVYSYVLSKILSKNRMLIKEASEWMESIEMDLLELIDASEGSLKEWNSSISSLKKTITSFEKKDARYIISLIKKGELKSAATLYAQGISLGLASQLTGMEKQEIMDYAGKTMMFDRMEDEKDIFERVKMARRLVS